MWVLQGEAKAEDMVEALFSSHGIHLGYILIAITYL